MTDKGRPLRFLVLVIGGWIAMRTVQLWPAADAAADLVAAAIVPPAAAGGLPTASLGPPMVPHAIVVDHRASVPRAVIERRAQVPASGRTSPSGPGFMTTPTSGADVARAPAAPIAQVAGGFGPQAIFPAAAGASRFGGSGWMIVRSGGAATPFAAQLGGSQAGVRLTYALDGARRLSLAARFSSALGSRQREAAFGVDWRPTALPIHVIAEQRVGIAGVRGGPALGLIGGVGPRPIAGRATIEAYAQGGAIARGGVEGFADGSLRLAHPVAALGAVRFDLGVGAWGGAQRGAARLDLGPSAGAVLPTLGTPLRLSLEWRQRVAGGARPGSGPALSLGTDF